MATNCYSNKEETREPIRTLNTLANLVIEGKLADGTSIASNVPGQFSELQDELLDRIDWAICVSRHQHSIPYDPFVALFEAIVGMGSAGFLGIDQEADFMAIVCSLSTNS